MVECPRCAAEQAVPAPEAAAAALAMAQSLAHTPPPAAGDLIVYETVEPWTEPRPAGDVAESPTGRGERAARGVSGDPAPVVPPARCAEAGMLRVSRRALYFQAAVIAASAVCFFAAGLLIGRGSAPVDDVPQQQGGSSKVLVQGLLSYDTGAGGLAADSGAVAILLPRDAAPSPRLTVQGIRPVDRPSPDHPTLAEISRLGGAYAQADDGGGFTLVLPREGVYRLLLISRHARRAPRVPVDEADLAEISGYFLLAENLLGQGQYHWESRRFEAGSARVEHEFGRDEGN